MYRHITVLEQKLLDNGFRLIYKTYVGKHSQKVFNYVYAMTIEHKLHEDLTVSIPTKVYLNAKKDKVVDIKINLNLPDFVSHNEICILQDFYSIAEIYVKGGKNE